MSKDYNYEVGYETLQKEWELQCKRTPRGVTLVKSGKKILLQFKTPNTNRSKYDCSCNFSVDGMYDAVRKAYLVKDKLKTLTSEVEFWDWYNKDIKDESQLVDDRITFAEAIEKVEDDFWDRPDRRKRKRDKKNPSDLTSLNDTYTRFFKHLPSNSPFNLKDVLKTIERWERGTKTYESVIFAMKHLAELNKRRDIWEALDDINSIQTKFKKLQNASLEEFLTWRDEVLGITIELDPRCKIETRKAWLWVFSMQIVYGLRISEAFAIKNLTEPYITEDGVTIPALSSPNNSTNLIYIGDKTYLGTTVKTGSRIARPQIPPKYPDLMERLEIKTPLVPTNKPKSKKPKSIANFYNKSAYSVLIDWKAPLTETHAFRHLANINGMQAGIAKEVRSQSLGHTDAMNDHTYKKRQSTQTTIDLLLNSNTQAIDFVTALAEAKRLLEKDGLDKKTALALLSVIYQKDSSTIEELL